MHVWKTWWRLGIETLGSTNFVKKKVERRLLAHTFDLGRIIKVSIFFNTTGIVKVLYRIQVNNIYCLIRILSWIIEISCTKPVEGGASILVNIRQMAVICSIIWESCKILTMCLDLFILVRLIIMIGRNPVLLLGSCALSYLI